MRSLVMIADKRWKVARHMGLEEEISKLTPTVRETGCIPGRHTFFHSRFLPICLKLHRKAA